MSSVTIDGKSYVPAATDSDIKIAVLQRGNVLVGRFKRTGDMCELTDASVIRIWGTTRGLGQIAAEGPTGNTKLDPCGRVTFHILTAVMLIDCTQEKWSI